jgi:amidophosphoribosyltransferase
VKASFDFGGELLMGHLRYGTSGGYNLSVLPSVFPPQPVADAQPGAVRQLQHDEHAELNARSSRWASIPIFATDTQAVLEKIGFFLDEEHEDLYRYLRTADGRRGDLAAHQRGPRPRPRASPAPSQKWDGGYTLCGLIGNGDAFVARDPSGIRPAFITATTRWWRSHPSGRRS